MSVVQLSNVIFDPTIATFTVRLVNSKMLPFPVLREMDLNDVPLQLMEMDGMSSSAFDATKLLSSTSDGV